VFSFLNWPWHFKRLLAAGAVCAAVYLPWTLYQTFFDPPGDRLLKFHLAGVEQVDSRPFSRAIADAYGALTFQQIKANKAANFATATADGWNYLRGVADFPAILTAQSSDRNPRAAALANSLRAEAFFHIGPCLGFLMAGPLALLAGVGRRFRSKEWRAACLLWLLAAASIVVWCLLMFGPGRTILHAGSYAVVLFAMAGSVLALRAVSAWLAAFIALLQIGLNFLVYAVFMRTPSPGAILAEGIIHLDTLLLCLCSLAVVLVLLAKLAKRPACDVSVL
jgi:hypothetical protein